MLGKIKMTQALHFAQALARGQKDRWDIIKTVIETKCGKWCSRTQFADEAVLFVTMGMDAVHTLLEADRVPWNVVIYHQPAELKTNAFTSRLGCNQHLRRLTELPLCIDSAPPSRSPIFIPPC